MNTRDEPAREIMLPNLEKRFLPLLTIPIIAPAPSLRLREVVERFAKIALGRHSIATASCCTSTPDGGPSHAIDYIVVNSYLLLAVRRLSCMYGLSSWIIT